MKKLLVIQSNKLLATKDFFNLCDYIQHQVDEGLLILNKDVTYEQVEITDNTAVKLI